MATNQKEYRIIINGIDESITLIDSLMQKLQQLEERIDLISKKKVEVEAKVDGIDKIDSSITTPKKTTSKTTSELDKELLKNEQLKNEEYQKELQTIQAIKQENKELVKLNKDIAEGIRNADGSYTNTLAGLRRQLGDMKKELATMDLDDADGIGAMTAEISALNDRVKQMEEDYRHILQKCG